MRKFLLITAASSILWACGPAQGADLRLPAKAPVKAPVAVSNWSGLWIGGHADYAADIGSAFTAIGGTTTVDLTKIPSGFGIGGGITAMYQAPASPWVVGLDADIGYLNLNQTGSINTAPVGAPILSLSNATNYLGFVDALVGYALEPELLVGLEGGVGFAGAKPNLAAAGICVTGGSCSVAANDTSVGYNIGGFMEYAIAPQVAVGIKGDYTHVGDKSLAIPNPAGGLPIATGTTKYDILRQEVTLKFKLF
jgi:opacity protein-like surface antigen